MFQFWHIMGKCTVVAKKELLYAGPFGPAAWLCDLVFIPRMQSDVARQVMHEAAKKAKKEKVMSIFTTHFFLFMSKSGMYLKLPSFRKYPL